MYGLWYCGMLERHPRRERLAYPKRDCVDFFNAKFPMSSRFLSLQVDHHRTVDGNVAYEERRCGESCIHLCFGVLEQWIGRSIWPDVST